jgi:hypothetical protein
LFTLFSILIGKYNIIFYSENNEEEGYHDIEVVNYDIDEEVERSQQGVGQSLEEQSSEGERTRLRMEIENLFCYYFGVHNIK